MNFSVIKNPDLINWSGNPIEYAIACAPYGATQAAMDIRLQLTLQVEMMRDSGIYQDIKTETLSPDKNGVVKLDVSTLADPYLRYLMPELNTLAGGRSDGQSRYFRLKWRTYVDGQISIENFTGHTIICKGGLPFDGQKDLQFFFNLNQEFIPLSTPQILDTKQPAFASFLYVSATPILTPTFICNIFAHGTEVAYNHIISAEIRQGDIIYVPLQPLVNQRSTEYVEIMELTFCDDNGTGIYLHRTNYKATRYFKYEDLLFINSLGGIDNIRCVGEIVKSGDYEQTIINLANTNRPSKEFYPGRMREASSSRKSKVSANTGFIPKKSENVLTALMANKACYQVLNAKLLPVYVTKKMLAGPASTAYLYEAQIEWTEAFDHQFFGILKTVYVPGACPALSSFTAVQENSTSIRVTWACPAPYDRVKVKVSNGTPADDIEMVFIGQYGTDIITSDFIGAVTVEARVYCGDITAIDGTVTQSLGPASTVPLTLIGNSIPVAINDYDFQLSIGHTTPQLIVGNLMTNDYDPDGDPIEVVAGSGVSLQGGFYTITADGKIFYTPPYPTYVGTDRFIYKVREIATGIESGQATAFITMVAGSAGEVVYGKIFYTNPIPPNVSNGSNRNSIVYIKFYADALCLVPKDITLIPLTFNYKKKETKRYVVGGGAPAITETTHSILGTGYQVEIHNGRVVSVSGLSYTITEFFLLPGTGYLIG